MTYNIHKCLGGLDGRYRPDRTCEVIAHHDPDIVFLQEVDEGARRSQGHRQIDVLGDMLGYRHRAFESNVRVPGGGRYGNGILSRYPLHDVVNVDLTLPPKKARSALHARSRVRLGRVTRTVHLFGMHLGLSGIERKLQLRLFLGSEILQRLHARTPVVVAWDLNDVWGTLGRQVLAPGGFRTGGLMRTFPAYAPMRALDGIHVRGSLDLLDLRASRLEVSRHASDHLPVVAELALR